MATTSVRKLRHKAAPTAKPSRAPQPQSPATSAPFLTRHEVAALTGVNVQLIDAAIRAGDLHASKIGKRRVLITRAAVDAWIAGARM